MDGQLLSETFVELTDTMVAGFDVIDFLHVLTDRSVQLLDVSAAGLLLADPRGELRVVAASSQAARLLELFQLQNDQDRKSTRLNSSHSQISYAVFCLKKKKKPKRLYCTK